MRILFIGDIFGAPGRGIVAAKLAGLVAGAGVDVVVANAENAAGGFGVMPHIADELLGLGIDVLTSGNHIWDKKDIYPYLDRPTCRLLRPANYPGGCPGRGLYIHKAASGERCAVINLQGRVFMPATDCPFRKADELLEALDPAVKIRLVDFHAEVTSEKIALGWYLDGRVTGVVGTHTHIPTADARVLPGGTAYQTDVGMTGPYDSVIGVEREPVLRKFLTSLPARMEPAKGRVELSAVLIDADGATGKATAIRRLVATY